MTNEISSQITSAVLKSAEPVSRPTTTASTTGVNNRQDLAVSDNTATDNAETGNTIVQNGDTGPAKSEVELAVSDINDYVQTVNRDLQFRVDDALPLGRSIVTVIDSDTKETIREFPSEEALALAHQLRDQAEEETEIRVEGLIISAQA